MIYDFMKAKEMLRKNQNDDLPISLSKMTLDEAGELIVRCPALYHKLPKQPLSEPFLASLVNRNVKIFHVLNNWHRTKQVCEIAFERDYTAIAMIPDEHLTIDMMRKAVSRDPLLIRDTQLPGQSVLNDEIVRIALSGNCMAFLRLPARYQTFENALMSFRATGSLPLC